MSAGEQLVGEVNVEENGNAGLEAAQERNASGELVDEEGGRVEGAELAGETDLKQEVELA